MRKFTLPAGTTNRHKWHKDAAQAIGRVAATFNQVRQLYGVAGVDETSSLVSVFSYGVDDPKNPEAVALYEALGERFGWQITRENAADVAEAFREALPAARAGIPVEDNRRTPAQDAERAEQRKADEAARQAAAAEKAARVEALAAELRKQYPAALGPDCGKSGHARAAANFKAILQARGLRVSVKSDSFSMGNSVTADILTPDLPPAERDELQALADRFSYGTFDPMTDCSGYDHSDEGEAWEAVNGRAKYCRAEFTQSDENRAAILAFLQDRREDPAGAYQVYSGAHPLAGEFWAQWAETHAAPEPAEPAQGAGYSIEKHHHTKRGFDFWLVVLAEKVERDEFERLRDSCKAAGGWYSRKWGKTPGGFAFKEREQAGAWAVEEFGGNSPTPPPDPTKGPTKAPTKDPTTTRDGLPEKFRAMADKIADDVEAKRGDHLENTPKRQREGMARRIEADRLERTAQALRALADMHEAGDVPELLRGFTSKAAVYKALGVRTTSTGYYHIAATDEHSDESPEAAALWATLEGKSDEQREADRLRDLRAEVRGRKIPGYFPTPAELARDMVDRLNIRSTAPESWTLLEPSAGCGAILDEVEQLAAEPLTVVYEVNPTLCGILQAKGYDARPRDFLQEKPGEFQFDAVLMNPPFEKMQDVDHVRHAFEFLKPGGRLVAIMSPGPFFRDTAKARDFRGWLEELGAEVEEIEAGAFKESGTGVASRLVVIDKPIEDTGACGIVNNYDAEEIEEKCGAAICCDDPDCNDRKATPKGAGVPPQGGQMLLI
jgi:hypothetical protein